MTENTKRVFGALLATVQIYITAAEAAPTKPVRDAFSANSWRAATVMPTPRDPLKVKILDYSQVYLALGKLEWILASLVKEDLFSPAILIILENKKLLLKSAKACDLIRFSKEMLGLTYAIETRLHRDGIFIYDPRLNNISDFFAEILNKYGSCQGI